MSISAMLSDIRLELTDEQKTRWTDEQLTQFVNKSIRRINQVLVRNEINFARAVLDVEFNPDGTIHQFPQSGTMVAIYGLYRKDTNQRLDEVLPEQWETIVSCAPLTVWTIINEVALYRDPVAEDPVAGKLVYYPVVTVDPVDSPWEGRLDDCIVEYASFRCKNVDEMRLSQDKELMADLEERIISNYKRLEQQHHYAAGWNT